MYDGVGTDASGRFFRRRHHLRVGDLVKICFQFTTLGGKSYVASNQISGWVFHKTNLVVVRAKLKTQVSEESTWEYTSLRKGGKQSNPWGKGRVTLGAGSRFLPSVPTGVGPRNTGKS